MSLPRFFLTEQVLAHETTGVFSLGLTPEDRHHAAVLRLMPGEHIAVIDADQDYFECEITAISRDDVQVRIATHVRSQMLAYEVYLCQALAKSDKLDMVFKHTTELGVRGFIPWQSERSVVKLDDKKAHKRIERFESIVKSAAMQSGQRAIPVIHPLIRGKEIKDALKDFDLIIVCWEESDQTRRLHDVIQNALGEAGLGDGYLASADAHEPTKTLRVCIVVGPEGGLTSSEISLLQSVSAQVEVISLGEGILRTETAGIVASALTIYELGGLQ